MWELDHKEGWALKNWLFWIVCWRKLLRVPWTARKSNQSILKEINPEYSLEGLKLKLQYFGHLLWTIASLEKTLILGKIEGRRKRGWQRMRWLDGITDSMDMNLRKSLWVGNAIQSSHPLSSPSPPAFNLSQYQGLFQWVSSSHQVAIVLELQHQSFRWIFRTDFL